MSISFACGCGKAYRVSPEHSGNRFKCENCGEPVVVPDEAPSLDSNLATVSPMPRSVSADETIECPSCAETIKAKAQKCRFCGHELAPQKNPKDTAAVGFSLVRTGQGQFAFTGDYQAAFSLVQKALTECKVVVKAGSPTEGFIEGTAKWGINPFGIKVTATFHSDAGATHLQIAANLTDAFDTFGVCKKKVAEISDRIAMLGGFAGTPHSGSSDFRPPAHAIAGSSQAAPAYTERRGASARGQATTGCITSCVGVLFAPAAIVGIIMCFIALNKMETSNNDDGKGIATTGVVVGSIVFALWLIYAIAVTYG